MNTKIDGLSPGLPRPSSSSGSSTASARAGAGGERRPVASDSVQVSGQAADLASLERTMAESPSFDEAKVAAVRTALDTGTYRIDPQEIAARLTDLERALQS